MKLYEAVQTQLSEGKSISQIKVDLKKKGFSPRAISLAISQCIQAELKKRNTSEPGKLAENDRFTELNNLNKLRMYATIGILIAILIITGALLALF